jgi:hypothetical protein
VSDQLWPLVRDSTRPQSAYHLKSWDYTYNCRLKPKQTNDNDDVDDDASTQRAIRTARGQLDMDDQGDF